MKEMKLQPFIDWLIINDYVSPNSAASYDSYVRNACRLVNIDIEKVNTIDGVEDIINYLSQPNVGLKKDKSPKTLTNYKSGLRMYGEFLNDTDPSVETEKPQEKIEAIPILYIGDTLYSKDELYKNFIFRLTTQDRFYDEIYFPISLMKQLFYKNGEQKYYNAVLDKLLDSTILHSSDGLLKLKEVNELAIENGKVSVVINGAKHSLLTPNLKDGFEPFDVASFKSVSLDHVNSQYNILHDLKNSLPMLNHLTKVLKQANPKITNRKSLSAYKKLNGLDLFNDAVDIQELKKEFSLIASKTQLQFMDRSMNTSKGKK